MSIQTERILLVDDEANVLKALSRLLRHYELHTALGGEEGLLLARRLDFSLVISDYRMPGLDGVSFLKKFKRIQPDAACMILTGYADLDSAQHAINEVGVFRFLNKPWKQQEIDNAVTMALEHRRITLENRELADRVRQQQALLDEQAAILRKLEQEEPGITQVNWGPDGSIILDDSELE